MTDDTTTADTTTAEATADTAAAAATTTAATATAAGKWWETEAFAPTREMLVARGLTVDDPVEALAKLAGSYQNAESRLGKPADTLIERPKKDQAVTDWMKTQRELFGIPEKAEDYKLDRPKDMPKDVPWDDKLEGKVRAAAVDAALTSGQLQAMTQVYAGHMAEIAKGIDTELQATTERMMTDLARDWGDQMPARIGLAKQAAQAVAAKAGLSEDAVQGMSMALAAKGGDANVIRFMAALGEMMGDDVLKGGGGGGAGFGTTPAEARQQLATLRAPGGAFYEASKGGDSTRLTELRPVIERLSRLAAG